MNKKPDAAFGCGGGAFSFACSARATSATASGGRRLIIARIGANGSDGLGGALPLFLVTIGQSGEPRWAAQACGSEGSRPGSPSSRKTPCARSPSGALFASRGRAGVPSALLAPGAPHRSHPRTKRRRRPDA